MEFTLLGLAVITVAWIVQLHHVWHGDRVMRADFLVMYGLGTVMMLIDSLAVASFSVWFLILILLLIVIITIYTR